jgi:hypothetical protein
MDLVVRARAIIIDPTVTWAAIEQETVDLPNLFAPYMLTLALIPAVSSFFGWSVLGVGSLGFSTRIPLINGLALMTSQYAMTLAMVWGWGWFISKIAGAFGGVPNLLNGVKLTVYASTPAMLAGAFSALPALSILALVGGLYSLYLVYVGLPILMKNPVERTTPYMVIVTIAGLLGSLAISIAGSVFMPYPLIDATGSGGLMPLDPKNERPKDTNSVAPTGSPTVSSDTRVTITAPTGEVKVVAESLQDMAKRLEALAAEQEKASKKQ